MKLPNYTGPVVILFSSAAIYDACGTKHVCVCLAMIVLSFCWALAIQEKLMPNKPTDNKNGTASFL